MVDTNKVHRKKGGRQKLIQRTYGIPHKIVEKIKLIDTSDVQKHKMYRFVLLMMIHYTSEEKTWSEFRDYPSNYLSKVFNKNYNRDFMIDMINHGIIERNESYSTFGKCKQYRFNIELLDEDDKIIQVPIKFRKSDLKLKSNFESNRIKGLLRQITFDKKLAYKFIKNEVTDQVVSNDIVTNNEIEDVAFKLGDKYIKKCDAINLAVSKNKDIIKYKKKYYIDNKDSFIKKRVRDRKLSYKYSIEGFDKKNLYAKRNTTNNRLDTNLTNMPSKLFQFMSIKGSKLKNIDLVNSQFNFLSKLIFLIDSKCNTKMIKNHDKFLTFMFQNKSKECTSNPFKQDDVELFHTLVRKGLLYEYVQRHIFPHDGEYGRKKTKIMMFELCFSKYRYSSAYKTKLKELFPNVVNFVDNFKKFYGNNMLAITLQKLESALFIDNIYTRVLNRGYIAFTKHDSIICGENNMNDIHEIISNELDEYFGVGNYKLNIE